MNRAFDGAATVGSGNPTPMACLAPDRANHPGVAMIHEQSELTGTTRLTGPNASDHYAQRELPSDEWPAASGPDLKGTNPAMAGDGSHEFHPING